MKKLNIGLLSKIKFLSFGFFILLFNGCQSEVAHHDTQNNMSMSGTSGMHDHGTGAATIKLNLSAATLKIGKRVEAKATLLALDGSPISLNDLKEVHTKKIHLLIIDESFSDYHHEHPTPTGKPGEYQFSFVPTKPGSYRVWADLHPLKTDAQEYVIADLTGTGTSEKITHPVISMETAVDGYHFRISSTITNFKKGEPALLKLTITDLSEKIIENLEPVMGAYAHIVGFSDNYQNIAHVHPMGVEPNKESDRGKGELAFHIQPAESGYLRLFAQVKINGKEKFAPFTIKIESN